MIKQVHEVYSLVGGGYNKRHVHGYAWTKALAQKLADTLAPRRYYIGVIHVMKVNGNWHRLAVLPIGDVLGNPDEAEESRIAVGDLPVRATPGMFFQINGREPVRLGLDIEKSINLLASYHKTQSCKLYTLRTGGMLPITFNIGELLASETRQSEIFFWLKHEIEFRKNKGDAA